MKRGDTPAGAFRRTVLPNGLTVLSETMPGVRSVRPCLSSEMCTRPSVPGMISTKAPNAVVVFTVPS